LPAGDDLPAAPRVQFHCAISSRQDHCLESISARLFSQDSIITNARQDFAGPQNFLFLGTAQTFNSG
jgi:hypothetical protein